MTRTQFNIKMASYQYRKSHCWDKTVVRSSYLHNGISYTGKMTSLYWIRDQWFSTQTGCNVESGHFFFFFFFMLTGTSHWTNNWSVRDLRSHVVMLMWCHCNMKFHESLFHTTSLSDLCPPSTEAGGWPEAGRKADFSFPTNFVGYWSDTFQFVTQRWCCYVTSRSVIGATGRWSDSSKTLVGHW